MMIDPITNDRLVPGGTISAGQFNALQDALQRLLSGVAVSEGMSIDQAMSGLRLGVIPQHDSFFPPLCVATADGTEDGDGTTTITGKRGDPDGSSGGDERTFFVSYVATS